MNRVRVSTLSVEGDTLVGDVTATGPVNRFFSGTPFETSYGTNVETVPEAVRTIPILAHACPVAWAAGADVVVDTVDVTFLESLRRVRSTLLDLYPEFMTGGAIHCESPVEARRPALDGDGGAGMLFTGGVDSTATFVRHREERPTLVGVRGWVIDGDQDERWRRMCEFVDSIGQRQGVDTAFVESNMLDFLATPLLQAHFQRYVDGAWYSSVGHGLGLLGLLAPLAVAQGWETVYIAATHTEDWQRPWGSRPDIDDEVAWTGTECVHDGYDCTRQEKLDLIATDVAETGTRHQLRTCSYGDGASNCNDCEKCHRTIVGLLLAGLDPNEHGYEFDAGTLPTIRRRFETGAWYISPQTQYHWEVLQAAAEERTVTGVPGWDAFAEWLLEQDFAEYVERTDRTVGHRLLQRVGRATPTPVYDTLYPIYRRVANNAV